VALRSVGVYGLCAVYRDKKVVGVFVRFVAPLHPGELFYQEVRIVSNHNSVCFFPY
jgi:hypothetical protein